MWWISLPLMCSAFSTSDSSSWDGLTTTWHTQNVFSAYSVCCVAYETTPMVCFCARCAFVAHLWWMSLPRLEGVCWRNDKSLLLFATVRSGGPAHLFVAASAMKLYIEAQIRWRFASFVTLRQADTARDCALRVDMIEHFNDEEAHFIDVWWWHQDLLDLRMCLFTVCSPSNKFQFTLDKRDVLVNGVDMWVALWSAMDSVFHFDVSAHNLMITVFIGVSF